MAKKQHDTPMLDQLESGPWPSFVTGLKRLAKDNDMMVDLMGQLETSYKTRKGYWKGGTVGVFGYGGGVIPRFTELKDENDKPLFPAAAEFHTIRIIPAAGMHYTSGLLREMCDVWEKHGSGLIAFHGQSGDIMLQGATTANVQPAFDAFNEWASTWVAPAPQYVPPCPVSVRRAVNNPAMTKPRRCAPWSTTSSTTCTARHCLTR